MYSLNEARIKARIQCAQTRIPIDIYEAGEAGKYSVKQSNLRNSPIYHERATYEKDAVIIRDSNNKIVPFAEDKAKKADKKAAKE